MTNNPVQIPPTLPTPTGVEDPRQKVGTITPITWKTRLILLRQKIKSLLPNLKSSPREALAKWGQISNLKYPRLSPLSLLISLLTIIIALQLIFGLNYLNQRFGLFRTPTWLANLLAPKIEYTFNNASRDTGYTIINQNRANGFAMLLSKANQPNVPSGQFTVEDSNISFSLKNTINFSSFVKTTENGRDLITWQNTLPDTDVVYSAVADGLKEDIILKGPAVAQTALREKVRYQIAYDLTTINVKPRPGLDGKLTPAFFDIRTGQYRFHLAPLTMVDANGVRYEALTYILKPITGIASEKGGFIKSVAKNLLLPIYAQTAGPVTINYQLIIDLPRDWLADPSRAYPVIIDPTIAHNTQSVFATGYLDRIKDEGATSSDHPVAAALDGNTLALWNLDETSDIGNVLDQSANSNTGTPTGTTIVAGRIVNARGFDGSSYINVPDSSSLDITGDFTISAWVKRTGGGGAYIVSKTNDGTSGGYALLIGNAGEVYCRTNNGTASNDSYTAVGLVTADNAWHHLAVTRSGTSCLVYVDGVDRTSTAATHTTLTANALPLKIGTRSDATTEFLTGQIDDVKISNVALTAGQVLALLNPGLAENNPLLTSKYHELPADANTIGLYHLDDTSDAIHDVSGFLYEGTNTGSTSVGGAVNDARSFTGGADINLGNISMVDSLANLTVEAWLYPTAQTAATLYRAFGEHVVLMVGQYGNQVAFYVGNGVDTWVTADTTGGTLPINQWSHVAWVKNGTNYYIYINGNLTKTGTVQARLATSTYVNYISTYDGTNQPWAGRIDELRISDIARTPEEIKADAQRYPYATYTSPVTDLTRVLSWSNLTWTAKGVRPVALQDGETPISTTGLIAQWNFNETSNTTAVSGGSCGTTCNGTLTTFASTGSQDAVPLSGWTANNRRWGAGAIMFDNTDDYVITTYNSAQNPTGSAITVETWVNSRGFAALDRIVGTANANTGYRLRLSSASANDLDFYIGNGTAYRSCIKPHFMIPGSWYHLAATYNGATFNLYVNGKNIGSCADVFTPNWGTTAIAIGGAPEYWNGTIDSTRIYNRALTASEILSNYSAGQIEFQTRTGTDSTPNDGGGWESWLPVSNETQIAALDSLGLTNWVNSLLSRNISAHPDGDIIKYTSTNAVNTSSYYKTIAGAGTVLATNDTLEYDVFLTNNLVGTGNIDAVFTDGTVLSTYVSCHNTDLTSLAYQKWYHRTCIIPSGANTKVIDWINLVAANNNNDVAATSIDYYDNLVVKNSSGAIKATLYASGTPFYNQLHSESDAANTQALSVVKNVNNTLALDTSAKIEGTGSNRLQLTAASPNQVENFSFVGGNTQGWIETDANASINFLNRKLTLNNVSAAWNKFIISYQSWSRVVGRYFYGKVTTGATTNNQMALGWFANATTGDDTDLTHGLKFNDGVLSVIENGTYYHTGAPVALTAEASTIGLWHFDETANDTCSGGQDACDSSTNANHGTATGTTIIDAQLSKGRSFTGADDISIGNKSIVDGLANLTVEAWLYPTAQTAATVYRAFNEHVVLYVGQYGNQAHIAMGNGTSWILSDTTGGTLPINQWSHVAWVKSGVNYYIYINGVLTKSAATAPATLGTSANVNYISTYDGTNQPWTGRLDELRISNVALTQAQIQADLGSSLYAATTSYETKITLKSTGADYAIKGGAYSDWTIIYNGTGANLTTTPMRIAVAQNNFLGSVDELAVQNDASTQLFRETFAGRQPWLEITDNGSINFWDDKIVLSNITQAWDKALISKNAFSRAAGKYLYFKYTTSSSVATPNHVMVGWFANADTGTYTSLTHGIYLAAGGLSVYENGGAYAANGPATTYAANTAYEFRITLKATGADYEVKGGAYSDWTIIYNGTGANLTTTPMRIAITDYNATGNVTELSVYDATGKLEFQDTFKGKQAWVEIDSNNSIDLLDNTVKLNTVSAAWSYGLISKNSYSRLPGRYLYGKYTTGASVTPALNAMVGWAGNTDAAASYTNINHALYFNSGNFVIYENSGSYAANGPATTYTTNTTYEFRITLKSIGAIYEVKGGAYTNWTLVYDGPGGGLSNEPMRVQIAQAATNGTFTELSVYDPLPTVSIFSQTISSTDLSAKTKLLLSAASDRPGTFISAMFGESAPVNYESDANTLALWHLEEKGTQDDSLLDNSGNGKNLALTGTSVANGKIGWARTFNGTSDYLCSDSNSNGVCDDDLDDLTTKITVGAWVNFGSATGARPIIDKMDTANGYFLGLNLTTNGCTTGNLCFSINDGSNRATNYAFVPALNTWYHIVGVYDGTASTISLYINGQLVSSAATSTNAIGNSTQAFCLGGLSSATTCATSFFSGTLDEVFISSAALTATDIRQAFEYGSRLHNITFDFVSSLQAAYSSGTSVTIKHPSALDTPNTINRYLTVGDTIIFKETVGGVETIGQAVVTSITTANWDDGFDTITLASAPSFPAGGYTTAAKVFKWQKEYIDISGTTLATDRDAVTRLTYRVYNNTSDTNIWLDDLRSSSNYLAVNTPTSFDTLTGIGTYPLSGASIPSALNRYFQYRSIFSTTNTQVSSQLNSVFLNYVHNNLPVAPVISTPSNGATNIQYRPAFTVSTTDADGDYLQYKFELATDSEFASIVMTANQNTSQTGWSGQNAASSTAYNSGSTATFTMQSDLTAGATYYLRATALDPVGGNIFSDPSATISFTVINLTIPVANPATNVHQTTFTANWSAVAAATSYRLDVSTAADFSSYVTGYENKTIATTSEILTNIPLATGQTYYYRVRAKSALDTSANSNTVTVRLGLCSAPISGNFSITSSCRFTENIDGVEQGDMTIVAGNTLTINAGQTIAWNQSKKITIQTGAHIAIADGGQVKQTNLWMQDVDADQYASSLTQAAANSAPNANYKRRYTMKTYLFTDQDDTLPEGYHSRPLLDPADGSTMWISTDNTNGPISTDSANTLKGPGSLFTSMQSGVTGVATDGACSVTSGTTNLNTASCSGRATADAVNFRVTANTTSGQNQITLASTPTGLTIGDEILIINVAGTGVGTHETLKIVSISDNTLTSNKLLLNGYNGTSAKIMVQRIPNYSSISISTGATLTANAYSNTTFVGGVIFIRATGTVTVDGTIDGNAKGYPGGTQGLSCTTGTSAANNGGGGGGTAVGCTTVTHHAAGGGGGGYGAAGTAGVTNYTASGGTAGASYGVSSLGTIFLGGGGGGGGGGYNSIGGGGGTGGGIIVINANSITVNASTGFIRSNGSQGLNNSGGGGGAGAGGTIRLNAPTTSLGTNRVIATSSSGGGGGSACYNSSLIVNCGSGGGGAVGRIRCDNTGGDCATTSPASNNNVLPATSNTNITIRRTMAAPLDLSLYGHISIWVQSSAAGANILQFGVGEAAATEQTWNITVNSPNTWEEKVYDISAIATTARDAIRYLHLKYLGTDNIDFRFNVFTYYE